MRAIVFVACILALSSCSAISKIEHLADNATVSVEKANAILDQGLATTAKIKTAIVDADKDQDGKLSGFAEIWAAITSILAIFGIGKAASANKQTETVAAKLSEHKKDIYGKIDDVRKELVG